MDDCSVVCCCSVVAQNEGEWGKKTTEKRAETFHDEIMDRCCRERQGWTIYSCMQHNIVLRRICLNVTGKIKEMITQGKQRVRADSLPIQVLIRNMWRELLVYHMPCGAFLCLPMPSGLSLAFRFFVCLFFLLLKKKSKTFLLISI